MNDLGRVNAALSAQDERDIRALLIAYGCAIDQRDWQALRRCFTADCEADYGQFGRWTSASAIAAFMEQAHAEVGPTLHRITNITAKPQAGAIAARSYVDALLMPLHEGGPVHRGIGYYDDQLVRTGQGWQISRRTFNAVLID